jgi:hypothetical protein
MNLSHVERYFSDFLSAIESGEEIPLYEGAPRMAAGSPVPQRLRLPSNFFIIGTVNVDESTYMFSPKVLDRANVIEFRMDPEELENFLRFPQSADLNGLAGIGTEFGKNFVSSSESKADVPGPVMTAFRQEMLLFFNLLRVHNAEFGYRTAYEAARFLHFYHILGGNASGDNNWFNKAMDAVIVQKFLPKLHGSRPKIEGLLWALAWACGGERAITDENVFELELRDASRAEDEAKYSPERVWDQLKQKSPYDPAKAARYPLSFDKVMRMWRRLISDQFVNFSEA